MNESLTDLYARHLYRVIESSDDAIVSKDLNGTITSWNRAAERIFGYTAAEAVGQSIRMIVPADRQAEEDDVLGRIRAGESVNHFETLRRRKDGTLVPISLTVSPIRDEAGQVVGASKIARDISDEKRAHWASRRLAAVVESSDDAIVTKDLTGVVTSWNRAAERMFGYTESEMVGQSIRLLIPEELQSEEDAVLARVRVGEGTDHYETTRVRKDGSRLAISLSVSPLRDDAGAVIGASKIARDITERVRLQKLADEHAAVTEKLHEVGTILASNLDRETVVQKLTDLGRELTTAEFGAFFYNVTDQDSTESYMLDDGLRRVPAGVREVSASARHGHLRADLPRRGPGAPGRRDQRYAIRSKRAVLWHAGGPSAGPELSRRAGDGPRPAKCWEDFSSATPVRVSSPRSMSVWPLALRPGPVWRSRTRDSTWRRAKRAA